MMNFIRQLPPVPTAIAAVTIAGIYCPINYIALVIFTGIYIYVDSTERAERFRLAQQAKETEIESHTNKARLEALEKELKEIRTQMSLSRLGGR